MPEYHAILRYLRQSPRKTRLLARPLVGLSVPEARSRLAASVRSAALPLEKLLRSAAANARELGKFVEEDLRVGSVRVDGGTVLKRFKPRAFGRASPIRKRTSHIRMTLLVREGAQKIKGAAATDEKSEKMQPAAEATPSEQMPQGERSVQKGAQADEQKKTQKRFYTVSGKEKRQGFMRRFFQRKSGM